MKAKILVEGLNINGKELKKDKIEELPWQIVSNYAARGWVEPVEGGEKDGLQGKTDTSTIN